MSLTSHLHSLHCERCRPCSQIYATASALLAVVAFSSMLADGTASALLALGAFSSMLADATASALLAQVAFYRKPYVNRPWAR
jgi:hypothetical protein